MEKYFAELKNNIIQRTVVATSKEWCIENFGGEWVQVEKPFKSWSLNKHGKWESPVPMPIDDNLYSWDESKLEWVRYNK